MKSPGKYTGKTRVHTSVAKRPCPACSAIRGALCFNAETLQPWATEVHPERMDARHGVTDSRNPVGRGHRAQETRVCAALKTCQAVISPLHQSQREQVMRGLHTWYAHDPVDFPDDLEEASP